MIEKLCKDCGDVKGEEHFSVDRSKKTGLATYCKDCQKVRKKAHYWGNPAASRASSNAWYYSNKERALQKCREWSDLNRDRRLVNRRNRYSARMKSDPLFRLDYQMRASIQRLIKCGGESGKLGYDADKLMKRIECQFKDGMSWDNYGDWEIDHKIPMSVMLSRGEMRPSIVNALCNLQPMWKRDNRSKGNRYVG